MKSYKKVEHILIKRIYYVKAKNKVEADTKDQAEEKAYEDISKTGYVDWHVGGHGDNEIIDVEEIK